MLLRLLGVVLLAVGCAERKGKEIQRAFGKYG